MLRLFGVIVRITFALQIAIIVLVAFGFALVSGFFARDAQAASASRRNATYFKHTASTLLPSGSTRKAA